MCPRSARHAALQGGSIMCRISLRSTLRLCISGRENVFGPDKPPTEWGAFSDGRLLLLILRSIEPEASDDQMTLLDMKLWSMFYEHLANVTKQASACRSCTFARLWWGGGVGCWVLDVVKTPCF